jgi:hypothetical protein
MRGPGKQSLEKKKLVKIALIPPGQITWSKTSCPRRGNGRTLTLQRGTFPRGDYFSFCGSTGKAATMISGLVRLGLKHAAAETYCAKPLLNCSEW